MQNQGLAQRAELQSTQTHYIRVYVLYTPYILYIYIYEAAFFRAHLAQLEPCLVTSRRVFI